MSKRDREFIELASLSIPDISRAIRKSPQAVRRGIKQDDDYLSIADILDIVRFVGATRPDIARLLIDHARSVFPRSASLELGLALHPVRDDTTRLLPSMVANDELWIVTSQFAAFSIGYRNVAQRIIEEVIESNSTICFFVYPEDEVLCTRFMESHPMKAGKAFCCRFDGKGGFKGPTYAVLTPARGTTRLFIVQEEGLLAIEAAEATNIVSDLLKIKAQSSSVVSIPQAALP